MKKNHFVIISFCLILSVPNLFAQDFSFEFLKPTVSELQMNEYSKDREAEALVIYDKGVTKFRINSDYSRSVVFTRSTKIKIISEAGLEYAEIEIPVYRHDNIYETVEKIEAYAYNFENNSIRRTKLNNDQVYEEKVNDFWYRIKFAIPNVKSGTVIEYKYSHISQSKFTLPDWEFQNEIPTLYSEYVLYVNPFFEYIFLLQGASKFDTYTTEESAGLPVQYGPTKYKEMINTFIMKDLPAFRDEEFISSKDDYIIKLHFQLAAYSDVYGGRAEIITTWPKLCDDLLKDQEFGKYIKSSAKQAKKLFSYDKLTGLSDEEKFNEIIQFVKSNFNWNEYRGYFASKSPGKFVSEKTGSAADINLFLCGMLLEAGLDARPVLISTRDHGKIRYDYPFAHFFNYVLVLVDLNGKNRLADATDSFCPDYLIPVNCINDRGLIIEKGSESWTTLTSDISSIRKYSFDIKLSPDIDSVLCNMKINSTNYEAMQLRKVYENKQQEFENYLRERNLYPIGTINVRNYKDVNQPFDLKVKIEAPLERIGNKIYIAPFFEEPVSENPLKQKTRSYPIDMTYAKTKFFTSQIQIPEGYEVEYIPKDLILEGTLVKIEYRVTSIDDENLMVAGYYKFNKAIYDAEDYLNLKYYFGQIVKKFNERIVLVAEK